MNVFRYEMKQYAKTTAAWTVSLAVMTFIMMSATTMFVNESSAMRDMLAGFPEPLRAAMGIDIDTFFSALGFYSYIFMYLSLAAAIQALNFGIGIISKENRMKTADFLMTKPCSRTQVYWQKFLAVICSLLITQAVFYLSAAVAVAYQSEADLQAEVFALISFTFTIMQMIFMTMGLLIAVIINKIKSAITLTMGIAFGFFIIGMVSEMAGSRVLRYLSPLKYFNNNYIMLEKSYEMRYVLISAVLTLLFAAAGFALYVRKDIKAV